MSDSRLGVAWRTAAPHFRRYRPLYVVGFFFLVATNIFQLSIPWLLKTGIDTLSGLENNEGEIQTLLWLALGIAGAAVMQAVSRIGSRWFIFRAGRDVEYDIRQQAYIRILDLDGTYYQTHSRGDVISRVSNDVSNVRLLFGFAILTFSNTIIAYISALSIMLLMSWQLTLMSLFPIPILFFVLRRFSLTLHHRFLAAQETLGDLSGYLQEALHGFEVVKGFAQEPGFFERFQAKNQANFDANMRLAWARSFMAPMMIFISGFGIFVVLAGGGYFVIQGKMTIGEFVAFQGYLGMLVWPTLALGWLFNVLERGMASLKRVSELLDTEPVIQDAPDALPHNLQGAIEVRPRTVRVGSSAEDEFKLDGIELNVKPGERIAVVGKTGAGKTTLLKAMMRVIDVPREMVYYDGVDVCDIQLEHLRGQLGYLPQEPFLFGRSIRDAMLVGVDDKHEDALWEALERANFADEMRELPRGLAARLGEKGVSLSGGQRQRLMIARLFLTDPRVVYFDSPLAAMDFVTADVVRESLQTFCRQRTVFWSTHRLERMEWFDRILVLDSGRIIAAGTHQELLDQELYCALYRRQQLLRALEST